jgi:hypothetical protein
MNPSEYGPFANIVAIACALVATFSALLLKMIGGVKRWSWLSGDSPSFLVSAGARVLAIALMAAIYITINRSNFQFFAVGAIACGVLGFAAIARFDRLRKRHVISIPRVGSDGRQLLDKRKRPMTRNIVIASESQLRPEVSRDLENARRNHGGLSLAQFMSGYGVQVNDPAALWDHDLLADLANELTKALMYVVLFAVITLFLAAFVIDVAGKST